MTDRHIMTQEQVATLELPEGRRLYQRDGIWYAEGDGWGVAAPHVALAKLAAAVANGYLPRAVLDHAIAASRGEDWQRRAVSWMGADVAERMAVRCGCVRCSVRMKLIEEATR